MRLSALLLLGAAQLAAGCATLSVPSPGELDASLSPPPGLVTAGGALTIPAARYPLHAHYDTTLEGRVTRLKPSWQVWTVEATATSEITKGPDGGLTWKVTSLDAKATLDGAPSPLGEEQRRALLSDYRIDRDALSLPRRAVAPGESWSNEVPILRVSGDGSKTTGTQKETLTLLGTVGTGPGARAVVVADVRSKTETTDASGAAVLAISSHTLRQVQVNLDSGTVEQDVTRRHEFAAGPKSSTETDGTVTHRRRP